MHFQPAADAKCTETHTHNHVLAQMHLSMPRNVPLLQRADKYKRNNAKLVGAERTEKIRSENVEIFDLMLVRTQTSKRKPRSAGVWMCINWDT